MRVRHAALAVVLPGLVVLGGYWIFRLFVVEFQPQPSSVALFVFAPTAAVASFFSPCSFPLLPGYLAHRAEIVAPVTGGRIPLATGFAAALGVLTFAILLGAAIALVSGAVIGSLSVSRDVGLQVFRGAVGVTLMLLGVTQFRPGGLGFARLRPLARVFVSGSEGHQMRSLYLYGLGYQTVGIGCSGPFLASLILLAMAGGGAAVALGAFAVYALTMTGLMVGVTLLVRYTELRAIGPLVRATPSIKRIAALVQLAVGAFLLLSSVFVELFAAALFP